MNSARQPVWVALLNPILGAAGVLLGAKLASPRTGGNRVEPSHL
jgi:hypothetical protein